MLGEQSGGVDITPFSEKIAHHHWPPPSVASPGASGYPSIGTGGEGGSISFTEMMCTRRAARFGEVRDEHLGREQQ